MISKELITQALEMYPQYSKDDECTGNIQYRTGTNIIHFEVNSNSMQSTNIYELQHKCKIWAYKNGFILRSEYYPPDSFLFSGGCLLVNISTEESMWFNGTLEPKAIFKACQWVLDNKESK